MRKRPKAKWLQSKENLFEEGEWVAGAFYKWGAESLINSRASPSSVAVLLYTPDSPHWAVCFIKPQPPHIIKYYPTKAAAKVAATLSL